MTSPSSSAPIAVLGAGITGLSAAYYLTQQGHRVRLFEAGSRAGGVVQTERHEGWSIESGPNSFQENSREITELITALGLDSERVVANPAAKKKVHCSRRKTLRGTDVPFGFISYAAIFGTQQVAF